ncbi:MAG TPA: pyridoxal phosphate-dependent aminotransferase [Euryarchaeota archaeon]|nr:aspartate aminotransferase [archaeon BMS3Bbin15]HDL16145.1 pyridoxal phosphate-dependent aminotransferase [Euryarchaeota archaeon]
MRAYRVTEIDISGIRKMFELAGGDVINLAIGEPDFPIPEEAKEAIYQALREDFTHYTSNKGIIELREALAEKLKKENGVDAGAEEIIITSGASEALHLAFQAFINNGEEVLIPNPGFVSYDPLAKLAQGKSVYYPLRFEEGFIPDIEDIKKRMSSKTKMIVLNSPGNPTGAVYPEEVIKAIAEIAEDYHALLVSDEVYEKIIYEGEHISPGAFSDNVITVNGFSKSYAMTGLRVGYLSAGDELVEEMLKVHQYIQASVNSPAQRAALAALGSKSFIENMVGELRERREIILKLLGGIEGVRVNRAGGAFYVFADFSAYGDSQYLATELVRAGVVVTPGTAFGSLGEGFLRFSYATSRGNIKEGVSKLKGYLEDRI